MPLPTPKPNEEQDAFVSRCIAFVAHEDEDKPKEERRSPEQRAAMCYQQWRDSRKDAEAEAESEIERENGPETPKEPPPVQAKESRHDYQAKIDDIDRAAKRLIVKITTDILDRDKEVMLPKGGNLDNYRKNPVVLWAHERNGLPIAKDYGIKTRQHDIVGNPQFVTKGPKEHVEFAQGVYELYAEEILSTWSLGFIPDFEKMGEPTEKELKARPDWNGARRLIREWELVEYSAVPVPANPEAVTIAVQKGLWVPKEWAETAAKIPAMPGLPFDYTVASPDEHEAIVTPFSELAPDTFRMEHRGTERGNVDVLWARRQKDAILCVHALRFHNRDWSMAAAEKYAATEKSIKFIPGRPYMERIAVNALPQARKAERVASASELDAKVAGIIRRVQRIASAKEIEARLLAKMHGRVVWPED
jgi:hypothetical protein